MLEFLYDKLAFANNVLPVMPVPVVRLKKEHYMHKKYGRIFTPVFEVVRWTGLEGTEADGPEPDAPEPEEAPRRRRRVVA